ncbi:MAG: hypothetical protein RL236_543 [Pseudomonadota bacterium]|jgi:recombination associated protein RdgC
MWFKNLSVFRLTEEFPLNDLTLAEKLETQAFHPCTSQQTFSFGWTAPLGKGAEQLVHESNGFLMICAKKEERVLPSSVINEMLQEKIEELEEKEGHKLSKKAKTELKDNLIFELLPRAFTFSHNTFAYIDTKNGFVIVDTASAKKAEDLLSALRKTLGGLAAIPLNTVDKPVETMTEWVLNQKPPSEITIEDECELRAPEEDGGIIRCKRHDLAAPEIKNHLDIGKQVIKLALNWEERLSFVLDENLGVKRLKFLDLIQEQVGESEAATYEEKFDIDFSIMTAELAKFLPSLLAIFGGENRA